MAGGVGVGAIAASNTHNRRHADRAKAAIQEAARKQAHLDAEALRQQTERDADALRKHSRDAEQARREAAEREARVSALRSAARFHPLGDLHNGFKRAHIEFENVLNGVVF